MVKDEDIVHIDVYRNDFHESMPMEDNAAKTSYGEKQIKQTKYIYVTDTIKKTYGEDKTEAGSSDKVSLKDVEIKETFMNPNWKRNSYDPLSTVSVEPVTQFVHRGDSVNLNMSMEIRNAEGILKSNQGMNIGNSNNQGITIENLNITQSDNDEDDSSKSPNELTQSKSFQSVEDDTPHLCCRKDKVVVYQCACCNRSGAETSNNFTAKPLFHGQGFYFLLPVAIPAQDR
ncbi:hypothetical protein O0L34_g8193 [Tuta absoluta]|nr:hypothetical protein O0L34_g8193 [Tuta absoluta]